MIRWIDLKRSATNQRGKLEAKTFKVLPDARSGDFPRTLRFA